MKAAIRAAAIFVASATSSACSDAPRPATTSAVDSAGIRIVSNPPGSIEAVESWSLSEAPVVAFGGGASPDVPLAEVVAVVPLDRGRVAVGMNQQPQVLVVESDGTLAATLGREGEGPGEFSRVASVVRLGADSLAVWDPDHRRISVFTEYGDYVRDVDLSTLAPWSPVMAGNVTVVGAFTYLLPSAPRALVLFGVGLFGPGMGLRRVEVPSYRITADGEELASFGPFPGEETYMTDQTGLVPFPFGADTHGVTVGDALVVGTAEAPELRHYGPDGTLERIVRWPDHDRTVGGPIFTRWNDFVDDWLSSMPSGDRRRYRETIEHVPQAERFPAYGAIVASEDGQVWVGEYAGRLTLIATPLNVRVPARRWLVFGTDGALAATVRTPEGFQPYAIREQLVWGVYKDELDVESVQAFVISSS